MKKYNCKKSIFAKVNNLSKAKSLDIFRKEIVFLNFFLIYIFSMAIFDIGDPAFEYIDYIIAIMLLVCFISMIVKVINESHFLKYEYRNYDFLNEKTVYSFKFLTFLILISGIIILYFIYSYLSVIIKYDFSLKLFFFVFYSVILYLIMKIFN
ncbi:hypothetical protein Xedl_03839 [Xenorhabdus eapokensis]|uniref:Uncharacterized protein n=1 Tax=Xenorhabdus eapokensis TaxID=1873482 RepID=A0A1Q5TED4_9GAMM|nr:hypothetical protein Xedl_03839 [Xenorhabdus eapokensis]